MKVLVTGAAGFIGFHVSKLLLERGDEVAGVDIVNDYYDPALKEARLRILREYPAFTFFKMDIADRAAMAEFFKTPFERIIHLAAQAGVRYSLTNPQAYIDSNIQGFLNILEGARAQRCPHLTYASSSSVYGANTAMPFAVSQVVDHPVSLYAATKKANELMAHCYSHLYRLPTTGLRFFTVYGPWGRPDMALFLFTRAILAGEPIDVFNYGKMQRDFTYIDDIAEGVVRVSDRPAPVNPQWSGAAPEPASSSAPYRLYNIGSCRPIALDEFINEIEKNLGKKAIRNYLPMQDGDVPATFADVSALERDFGYRPTTSVQTGVRNFIEWYRGYYRG